jgi:two-component system CAI-1 autoinducer sensor kinase/phosphatase CqsS
VLQRLRTTALDAVGRLSASLRGSARHVEEGLSPLGTMAVASLPLAYAVWIYAHPSSSVSLIAPLGIAVLSVPMLICTYLPSSSRAVIRYFGPVWLVVSLPGLATYLLLTAGPAPVWLLGHLAAMVLVFVLVDVLYGLAIVVTGLVLGGVGYLAELATGGKPASLDPALLISLVGVAAAIVMARDRHAQEALASKIAKEEAAAVFAQEMREKDSHLIAAKATIAHELRTPLASIRLAAKSLSKQLPELMAGHEAAAEAGLIEPKLRLRHRAIVYSTADLVAKQAEHALATVEMLLTAAQFGQFGAQDPVDAGATVEEAIARYPFASDVERARVRVHVGDNFTFFGSRPALTNVMFNLVKNALHYTGQKAEAFVHVHVHSLDTRGRITVLDNGTGISPDMLPHVFQPFSSGRGRPDAAVGIGLAFCEQAIQSMGGQITCMSGDGVYTRFTISLPLAKQIPSHAS